MFLKFCILLCERIWIISVFVCIFQDKTSENSLKMAWSSENLWLCIHVHVSERMLSRDAKVDILVRENARVRQMPACHRRLCGYDVCVCCVVCWSATVKQRRLTSTCKNWHTLFPSEAGLAGYPVFFLALCVLSKACYYHIHQLCCIRP